MSTFPADSSSQVVNEIDTSSETKDCIQVKDDSDKGVSENNEKINRTDGKEENDKNKSDKEDVDKEDSEKEDSEDEQEEMGLLDRPVEVTGCRARKQVERLDVSFAVPTKDKEIPVGRGTKLGDCPRIEFQITKHAVVDLKPLHRILFNRQGTVNDTKRNIRKFSGFPFDGNSSEFDKTKAKIEKNSIQVLKTVCEVLDIERSGTKEEISTRILQFLICPKDSGKPLPKKKVSGRDKKAASKKKGKNKEKKTKAKSSEEEGDDEVAPSADEASDASAMEEDKEDSSDVEKKSKSKAKSKKTPLKVKTLKKEKPKKEAKGLKRKNVSDSSDEGSEPVAKKAKTPEDDDIKDLVKNILEAADLHEITMKKVIKQVYDTYPDCDLTDKKPFIKKTIKTVLQLTEKGEDR